MFTDIPPHINLSNFNEQERSMAWEIGCLLSRLGSYAKQFEAALALFDFSEPQAKSGQSVFFREWLFIAARDGAITLYNFKKTTGGIRGNLKLCPTLKNIIDESVLSDACKKFNSRFPFSERVRHGIGHESENAQQPEKHATSKKLSGFGIKSEGTVMIQNHLHGRIYAATVEGELVSYELSRSSLDVV